MSDPANPATPSGPTVAGVPRDALIDLLGLVAYGELLAFDRAAADARLAPDLKLRAAVSEMATDRIANHRRVVDRLAELGAEPAAAMAPFLDPLRQYHDLTAPKDWLEALTRAYVGDAVVDDCVREMVRPLDEADRRLVLDVVSDRRYADLAATELRAAIAADAKVANRLSMWARRLAGEGLALAARLAAERPALNLLIGASGHGDVRALSGRLVAAHTDRMAAVGLNN